MKIIRIPTFWTAEQADTIHAFLGELRVAVGQEYHDDIQHLYDERRDQAQNHVNNGFDDDVEL